ncbi:sugar transferase [Lachnospiraceae bacterium CLA-AA-H215]|uniref:Sugar transferase n=1 Tax=Hominifimenecus microfluidus TaxID=2885348 RepID=A0AAE3EB51_9FIRM|nr:sugar transferase [Hominifimenecus microfluidus]MCC2231255.1 sugar transferase [Hominifimenecus microfluidus]
MYKRETEGWFKHYDFILLDMLCLQIAFFLAYVISGHGTAPYSNDLYRNVAIVIELADLVILYSFNTMKRVLKRGHYREVIVTLEHTLILAATISAYLFISHEGGNYSRSAYGFMMLIYLLLTYVTRELWKSVLRKLRIDPDRGSRSLLIITTSDVADEVLTNIRENNYAGYHLAGLAVLDRNLTGVTMDGIPVVAGEDDVAEYVCQAWIDEVLIVPSAASPYPEDVIRKLEETGVTIHMNLLKVGCTTGKKRFVEKIGTYTVLTTTMNYASAGQLFLKRLADIVGGLLGCVLTGIIFIFVAPMIYTQSPGPIFFAQERVGKNGKRFKMYKFRSMYLDAEAKKAELMKDNKLGDGKMFKLDFDPRVIGNKILPDGTKKTGVGDFIRRTSLDEFPQFFNVLKGDMSIVGTRPPLVGEVSLYELHHRSRLAIKPGITGMWQVSGRSDITDFEEVVDLDRKYINEWNLELDIKILFKTVAVVLKKDGSM